MIPSVALKLEHPRAVALVSEVEGVFVVEPMRFLWPSEARREVRKGLASKPDQLPWCPDEYKALYRDLRRNNRLSAAEARPLVEEKMAIDRRRRFLT